MKIKNNINVAFNKGTDVFNNLLPGTAFYYEGRIYIKCRANVGEYEAVNVESGKIVGFSKASTILPLKDAEFNPNYKGLVLVDSEKC